MPSFPFFRLPFPNFYTPYYNSYKKINNYYNLDIPNNHHQSVRDKEYKNTYDHNKKTSPKYNSFSPFDFINNVFSGNTNAPIFEIFGIELYLDDIIILGLLFILYKEGVQDEMLFLSLVLLLLT